MAISAEPQPGSLTPPDITALIESTDWERTSVGARSTWPQSLQTSLSITVNSAFPILLMWGPDLTVFYNAGYAAMLGAKHPWAMGRPMRDVWSEIWDIVGPMLDGVVRTGKPTYSEDLLLPLFRNGYVEECYFTFSYSPIPDGDGIGGVFCAVAETTSKVIGERRLRTLHELESQSFEARGVDAATSIAVDVLRRNERDVPFSRIYLLDKNDRLRLVDGSGPVPRDDEPWPVEEVARSGEARVVASTIDATASLVSAQSVTQAMVLPIASGAIVLGISPFCQLDGEYRRFLELVAGQIAAAINSARAYAEAQSRAEALAELDRAKTAFFSNISHEFRTPLTLLLGPIEHVLQETSDKLDSETRGELFTARRNAYRLLKLVNHLLEFSRIEAGRSDASFELTDIAQFAAEIASGFRSAIERAGLQLIVEMEPPIEIFVDRGMFERIVLNLLSNAFKYTFKGSITVRAWCNESHAFLCVADTGSGIPSEEIPTLFERFRRVRAAKSRADEGTGIGLALVDELVRLHGGTIQVESRLEEGSAFTIALPFGTTHLPSEHIVAGTAPAHASALQVTEYLEETEGWLAEPDSVSAAAASDETILVVDDNGDLRSYLQRILTKRWNVEFANDGLLALERIRQQVPDLVLSDIMMPNCDGLELLRRLRSDPRTERLPIILLSARAGEEASIEGLQHGADDYIVKPFSEEQLVARVEAALKVAKVRQAALENAVASGTFLRTLADALPQMILTALPDGTIEYFNQRWYEYTGMNPDQSVGGRGMEAVHPDDAQRAVETWTHSLETGEDFSIEVRIRDRAGGYRWFLCRAVAVRDPSGAIVRWLSSATDIDEQKRLAERQRFIQHAGEVLASTLDVTAILEKITQLCVPALADWCQIQVLSSDDRLMIEAVQHRDPERAEILKRLVGRQVVRADAVFGSPQVLRGGETRQLDHAQTLRAVSENVTSRADRRAYEEAGLGTALIVPLVAREESLGTLHLVNTDPETFHSAETMAIAEELARRAALAIANSRLYQREHRVATALQQAMLPASLPKDARVEFNFAYRPAERESQVGGDWYDAFAIAPDQIAVSIGDVGGHGLGAAVAMSEARQALRLGALEGLPPAELLARVNSTLILNERQPIITAIFGVIDLARSTFTYSSAGHPPPALAMLGNGARYLAGGGIPIGVMRDVTFPTHEVQLEPYSTLLLYTDGLIEFSRDIATESNRLLEALHDRVQDLLADGAEALLRYMLTRKQVDDIAILIATLIPQREEAINLKLPAVRESSAIARRIADRFTRVAKVSEERAFNLALALGEGVANAAEHAYGGQRGDISLSIWSQDGIIGGSVSDVGQWREGPPMLDRGRGLEIVNAVTKRARVERTATGTTLSFEV